MPFAARRSTRKPGGKSSSMRRVWRGAIAPRKLQLALKKPPGRRAAEWLCDALAAAETPCEKRRFERVKRPRIRDYVYAQPVPAEFFLTESPRGVICAEQPSPSGAERDRSEPVECKV